MEKSHLPLSSSSIGIFDSGSGGLTILQALEQQLPDQTFVYYGDYDNAPYGSRDSAEICQLTVAAMEIMFARGCRLIILACNTASAVALRWLQQEWLPSQLQCQGCNILGIVVPVVESLTGQSWHAANISHAAQTVTIFATPRTVASQVFPEEITKRAPDMRIIQEACPTLATAIENNASENTLRDIVSYHVDTICRDHSDAALQNIILGCTHYPHVQHLFAKALPPQAVIFSQGDCVAIALEKYLNKHPQFKSTQAPRPYYSENSRNSFIASVALSTGTNK